MKLEKRCADSGWADVGREEIITNLPSIRLTLTKREALSLRRKFDKGGGGKGALDFFHKNVRYGDSEVEMGFKQGVEASCLATKNNEPVIPRRYIDALRQFGERDDVVITTSDKVGGIVVFDRSEYLRKAEEILADRDVYEPSHQAVAEREALLLNQQARRIVRRTVRGAN